MKAISSDINRHSASATAKDERTRTTNREGFQIKNKKRPIVFDMTSNLCVWVNTGLMPPSPCINAFNCLSCPVDKKMQARVLQKGIAKGPACDLQIPLHKRMVQSHTTRKCRHMLSGRVAYKYCVHNYDCATCAYHQMIEDEAMTLSATKVEQTFNSGFSLAKRYYYHRGHTWARVEYGGRVRVGVDDFAMRLVGALDHFNLPVLGQNIRQGRPEIGISRGKLKAESISPIEGTVVAVNSKVAEDPGTANRDPYGEGWLMIVEPVKLRVDLKNLIYGDESTLWIEDEVCRLGAMMADDAPYPLAATGGRAVNDIYGEMPELGWDNLVNAFFLTG